MRSISRLYLLRLSSFLCSSTIYLPIIFFIMLIRTTGTSHLPSEGVLLPKESFPYEHPSPTQKTAEAKKLYLFHASPLRTSRSTLPVNDSATINLVALSPHLMSSRGHHHYSSKSSPSSSSSAMYHHQVLSHNKLSHDIGRIKRSRAIRDSFQALNQLVLEKADYGTIVPLRPPLMTASSHVCLSLSLDVFVACLPSHLSPYLPLFLLLIILPFSYIFGKFSCPEWLAVTSLTVLSLQSVFS